jgi:hypothetical protein
MGEIQNLGQDQRDAQIWAEWVSGTNQITIGERRGIGQPAVSKAIRRFWPRSRPRTSSRSWPAP